MRILQIAHGYPPEFITGTERYVEALSRGLVEAGHRCFVLAGTVRRESYHGLVTVMQDGVAVTRVVSASREIDHWTQYDNAEAEILIRGYLEMLRPDLVHVHHWLRLTGNLVAICKELGLPVVVTLHDAWTTCARIHRVLNGETLCTKPPSEMVCTPCVPRHPWHSDEEVASEIAIRQEWVERELRLADEVITPSLAQKSLVERMLRLPEDRIQVVPLGTPSSMVVPHTARAPGYPERRLRMAYWGAIKPEKGVHVLLEAVRRLSDPSAVEVHLFGIIETPKYQQRLLELASGISVTFHDSCDSNDLAGNELDLAVVTSFYHESYSFVLDEAFQLGLAVIVSDRGALPERVGPGGLVFPAGDAAAVAHHIQALLDDPTLLSMMKCAHAGKVVSMRKHLAQLSEVYGEVMSSVESRPIPASDHLERLARKHRQLSDREAFICLLQHEEFVRRVREVACVALPADATVLVVSRGDDDLLELDGRRAWHFPQSEDGVYAGYYPADSAEAIAHLETLRAKGGDFLLFPSAAFWWLEHYAELKRHLESRHRVVVRQEDTCVIFALREPEVAA
ncbi:MAG TPA: glycosyltransferase [Candidatus Tectomicrobia bacterium]